MLFSRLNPWGLFCLAEVVFTAATFLPDPISGSSARWWPKWGHRLKTSSIDNPTGHRYSLPFCLSKACNLPCFFLQILSLLAKKISLFWVPYILHPTNTICDDLSSEVAVCCAQSRIPNFQRSPSYSQPQPLVKSNSVLQHWVERRFLPGRHDRLWPQLYQGMITCTSK